jgi:hypothetical protein
MALPTDLKFLRQQELIARHAFIEQGLEPLASLLERTRAADHDPALIELERVLIAEAVALKERDETIKNDQALIRKELRKAKRAADHARVREAGDSLAGAALAQSANRRIWSALRSIHDGIVWRRSGFDRHVIAILGQGNPVLYLSTSLEHELAVAENHWQAGRLALLCDLSSCIHTGDLLVFDESNLTVVEVKESSRDITGTAQWERMATRVDYLQRGVSDSVGVYRLFAPQTHPAISTHLSLLEEILLRRVNTATHVVLQRTRYF